MALFEQFGTRLGSALDRIRGRGRLTEANIREVLREVRMALLEADVALPVTKTFLEEVRQRAIGEEIARSLNPGQTFVKIVHDELVHILSAGEPGLSFKVRPPAVILLAGLQGSGKTTTAAKLARWLMERERKRVMLASTDVYRPAAREQLAKLAEQIEALCETPDSDDPERIAKDALAAAKNQVADVLIIDTAGRLHVDDRLMQEIRKLSQFLEPVETLFVADSMTGQDAVRSAQQFGDSLSLTGIILTKTDGDARGGAALSIARITGKPIKFLGTGEQTTALEPFRADGLASRILGMGDVVSLVEDVGRQADQGKAEVLARKLRKGRGFDLEDFKGQLEQMLAMGGMGALMEKLPGANRLASSGALSGFDDGQIRRQIAIINSMTPRERTHPGILNGSRRRRIANGSGTQVQEVNRLLRQHGQAQKMMKKLGKRGNLAKALRGFGAGRPPLH